MIVCQQPLKIPVFTHRARERARELYEDRPVDRIWESARLISNGLVAGLLCRRLESCRDTYHVTDDHRGILVEVQNVIVTVIRLGLTAQAVLREPKVLPKQEAHWKAAYKEVESRLSNLLGRPVTVPEKSAKLTGVGCRAVMEQLDKGHGKVLEKATVVIPLLTGKLVWFVEVRPGEMALS